MISLNTTTFKQVAEKFSDELKAAYCSEDVKIKHSFALEALSRALGYKDYNTIKPKLDDAPIVFTSIAELEKYGYVNAENEVYFKFDKLHEKTQRQLVRRVFLQLIHFYRHSMSFTNYKCYFIIDPKEYEDYAEAIVAASVCLGVKLDSFATKDNKVVVHWIYGDHAYDVGPIEKKLDKDRCMQIYKKDARAIECVFKNRNGNQITVDLFGFDGHLRDSEMDFNMTNTYFLTYKSDLDMRKCATLVNDITNKEFDYMIFASNYGGMIRARYVVENHPEVAQYVLNKLYGYALDFL